MRRSGRRRLSWLPPGSAPCIRPFCVPAMQHRVTGYAQVPHSTSSVRCISPWRERRSKESWRRPTSIERSMSAWLAWLSLNARVPKMQKPVQGAGRCMNCARFVTPGERLERSLRDHHVCGLIFGVIVQRRVRGLLLVEQHFARNGNSQVLHSLRPLVRREGPNLSGFGGKKRSEKSYYLRA